MGFLRTKLQRHRQAAPEIITGPYLRILNYQQELRTKNPRRALLSYLSQPVLDELNGGSSVRFSNDGLATAWPKVLNRLGYTVDIINWDDTSFVFPEPYDVVVGHGGINYEQLAKQFDGSTTYIYFSTGSYWKFHNQQEEQRFAEFEQRHGKKLPNDRRIDHPEEAANRQAKAIICLGNQAAADTYQDFTRVYHLPIGSFTTAGHHKTAAEIEAGRRHILFVAGAGNIHKGLDLVLDAVERLPEMTLHIYTLWDEAFVQAYGEQLRRPNIKQYDFAAFPNEQFLDLTRQCNSAIMPSCSEGSPGSIAEAAIQGLIPIVSQEAHFDVDDFGVILADNSVACIEQTLRAISTETTHNLQKRSRRASDVSLRRHAKHTYEQQLQTIMKSIEEKL